MDNNCHILALEEAFFYVEHGDLNLVLKPAKPLCDFGKVELSYY